MKVQIERVYDMGDKLRKNSVLVDRLWPRGITKEKLGETLWLKELAPSNDLRRWFHQDKSSRLEEFNKKYLSELRRRRSEIEKAFRDYKLNCKKEIILLTGVKDVEKSHIPVLKKFLEKNF